jgi:hypothetical protein
MKKNTFLLIFLSTFFIFNNHSYSQTFNWETATDNGATVSEIKSGITATVAGSFSGINLFAANGMGGTSGNVVVNEFTNENTSATISFSSAQNVATINAVDGELTGSSSWTFTPVPLGANTAITTAITGTVATVVLNFTSVTSVIITSSQAPNNKDTFAFDDVVLGSGTTVPSALTLSVTPISSNTATLYGTITANGGDVITERGFVYALTSDDSTPTVAESSSATVTKVIVAGTTGAYNQAIANLMASSEYSYTAYAINSVGTKEGIVETFTTISNTNECLITNPFDSSNFNNGALHFGQSFVACQTGKLESIGLLVTAGQSSTGQTINIYSGTVIDAGNLLGSITNQDFTENGGSATNFDVTDFSAQNINLTAGQTYTFDIPTISNLIYTNDNGYSSGEIYLDGAANGGNYDLVFNINIISTSISWTGAISSAWSLPANWSTGTLPTAYSKITIPSGLTNYPTTSSAVTFNSLTINSGASFIAQGTVTGPITYKRNIPDTNWHLVGAPVLGETQQDIITNHTFATGTSGNIGIGAYSNNGPTPWLYANLSTQGPIFPGFGTSMKLAAPGDVSITGNLITTNYVAPISTGSRNNFNLMGNPYLSYMNSATLAGNNSGIHNATFWFWNGTQYITHNNANPIEIAPAQGYFVEANTNTILTFFTADQSHQSTDTFMRQIPKPSFELFVENEDNKASTKVFYIDGKTTGQDIGYDSKMFGGAAYDFALFTELVTDNKGDKLAIQSLPNSDLETIVIPVGVIAEAGKEITFSISSTNLPSETNVYLEDRLNNTFTNLSYEDYNITLDVASKDIGQFYIHTSSKSLNTQDSLLENVCIYKTNNNTLRITGLQSENVSIKVFNMLGKQMMTKAFKTNGVKDILLPRLASGMYLVQLQSEKGKLNKKIILE